MGIKDQLERAVRDALTERFEIREDSVVPDPSRLAFRGGAVRLPAATVLYADLSDSTGLSMRFDASVAARVGKAFLETCSRIIRDESGEIRSFDGDRVMALFLGASAEASAVRCAFKISACFSEVLKPRVEKAYPDLAREFKLGYACGVDRSEIFVVGAGLRTRHDLIWIGRAPNVAAKLSSRRELPFTSWITSDVMERLPQELKTSTTINRVWEPRSWSDGPVKEIHGSSCIYTKY